MQLDQIPNKIYYQQLKQLIDKQIVTEQDLEQKFLIQSINNIFKNETKTIE